MYLTTAIIIKNGWLTYDYRVMYMKYTTPMTFVECWRILRWHSQQKRTKICILISSFFDNLLDLEDFLLEKYRIQISPI